MTFGDIPGGASVFIDANAFVYACSKHAHFAPACHDLLERIDRAEISGSTTTHVLAEIAHRLMTLEACAIFGWPFAGIAQRLSQHSAEVQRLSAYRQAIADVLNSQINVLVAQPNLALAAADISRQHGLLTNDALIVAAMQANGLTSIASQGSDFDRVPGLTRYAPA